MFMIFHSNKFEMNLYSLVDNLLHKHVEQFHEDEMSFQKYCSLYFFYDYNVRYEIIVFEIFFINVIT